MGLTIAILTLGGLLTFRTRVGLIQFLINNAQVRPLTFEIPFLFLFLLRLSVSNRGDLTRYGRVYLNSFLVPTVFFVLLIPFFAPLFDAGEVGLDVAN